MQFDFKDMAPAARYKLVLATVVPRPIAWITTHDKDGVVNAAPFSFFNVFGRDPALVGVGIGSRPSGEPKDTRLNIREMKHFVVNLVPFSSVEQMRVTSVDFPKGVEESKEAGLHLIPSARVTVPRIAESPVAFECELVQEISIGDFGLVLGEILMAHVLDEAVVDRDRQYVDPTRLDLVGRMEGGWYTNTRNRFELPNIAVEEWERRKAFL